MDHQIARREAENLGLTDTGAWTAATNYVSGLSGPRTTANPADAIPSLSTPPIAIGDVSTGQKPIEPVQLPTRGLSPRRQTRPGPARAPRPRPLRPVPLSNWTRRHRFPRNRRVRPYRRCHRIAPARRDGYLGSRGPPGLLEPHGHSRPRVESSGQSPGIGASTEIAPGRVGCVKVNCRA